MRVILLKEIQALGKPGEVKRVKDGYARNFLIPRGLAKPATDANIASRSKLAAEEARREVKARASWQELAERLKGVELRFALKMGDRDKAFGSVTSQDIKEKLADQGIEIKTEWINLTEHIRTAGAHTAAIRFPYGITAEVKIVVETETPKPKPKAVRVASGA